MYRPARNVAPLVSSDLRRYRKLRLRVGRREGRGKPLLPSIVLHPTINDATFTGFNGSSTASRRRT